MRHTKEIFQRLSRGQFISSNSVDRDIQVLYNDIEENRQEYYDYFSQIDFKLMGETAISISAVMRQGRLLRISSSPCSNG